MIKSDGVLIGQELTLLNFTNSIFETKHKESKKGKFLFSGGKAGPISKEEYQKQVIQQQSMSEFLRTEMKSTQLTNSQKIGLQGYCLVGTKTYCKYVLTLS